MSGRLPRPPANPRTFNRRITGLANELGRPVRRIQRAVANTVVGQMLPPGVVKGGTAIKLRVGEAMSRFTPDLDTSPRAGLTLEEYVGEFQERLHGGWGGFTGTVETLDPAQPEDVPDEYVMRPYGLALAFQSRHWLSVPLEVGHDEVGSTTNAESRIAEEEPVDLAAVGVTTRRLFASRKAHPWPPTVVAFEGWPAIYADAAEGLDVLPTVDAAVAWANQLVAHIEEGLPSRT